MSDISFRDAASNAVRFWEPARIAYNLVLLAIVAGYFVAGLPGSQGKLSFDLLSSLFLLAVLANVAYCAAYVIDIFAQFTSFRELLPRVRWVILVVGLLFAMTVSRFFAMGLFFA
jgi:hypothetical protein